MKPLRHTGDEADGGLESVRVLCQLSDIVQCADGLYRFGYHTHEQLAPKPQLCVHYSVGCIC